MVEIAKALVRQPRLIIMDEATSALTAKDVEQLYKVIRQLRDRGLAILYISHRMHEIAALADTCSVFRNGHHIDTFPMATRTAAEIVPLMIGREVSRAYPAKSTSAATKRNSSSSNRPAQGFTIARAPRHLGPSVAETSTLGSGGTAMPVCQKGDVRIRYEETGSGFPLLVTRGAG